jgi:hypothetical protein
MCRLGVGAALFLVALSLFLNSPNAHDGHGLEPLLFVVDPIRTAIDTLGVLFVIALFVERANEIFVVSTRTVVRKRSVLQIEQMENATSPDQARIIQAKETLLTYRTGTKILTITFSIIVATVLALGGVRALSPLLEVQFDALSRTQWAVLHIADIVLTVAIIGGGSKGVHRMISTITDHFPDRKVAADADTNPS